MTAPKSFVDAFGHAIELTKERWLHVLTQHEEVEEFERLIPLTLQAPDVVVSSVYDADARLYYKRFADLWHGKYLVVVVKFSRRNFIVTVYITDKIKGGTRRWPNG